MRNLINGNIITFTNTKSLAFFALQLLVLDNHFPESMQSPELVFILQVAPSNSKTTTTNIVPYRKEELQQLTVVTLLDRQKLRLKSYGNCASIYLTTKARLLEAILFFFQMIFTIMNPLERGAMVRSGEQNAKQSVTRQSL